MAELGLNTAVDDGPQAVHLEVISNVPGTPASPFDHVKEGYRSVARFLTRRALFRAARAVPRTLHFVGSALSSGKVAESLPAPRMSLGLAAQVAMDEALLAMALTPRRFPRRADYASVSSELANAEAMHDQRGWLADPRSYHRTPPLLSNVGVTTSRGWAMGLGYARMNWQSGFAPHPGEPGEERWMGFEPNHTASAVVLRHPGGPRPWVIAVHGFCMGFPFMDFPGLQAARLHRELGFNVALPVLPLHGPRRVTRVSGEALLSFDLMNAVHGLTQAVWDIRRLIHMIREEGATSVSLYGISLGAYVVSLLSGIEDGVDAVVAGIPVTDFPGLFHRHSPHHLQERAIEHRIIGGVAENVYRVVSPMSFEARVPKDRRFIFAGYGDRLAMPEQAQRLWEHWDQPSISWYPGSHVGYMWSKQVSEFLACSLGELSTAGGSALAGG